MHDIALAYTGILCLGKQTVTTKGNKMLNPASILMLCSFLDHAFKDHLNKNNSSANIS